MRVCLVAVAAAAAVGVSGQGRMVEGIRFRGLFACVLRGHRSE